MENETLKEELMELRASLELPPRPRSPRESGSSMDGLGLRPRRYSSPAPSSGPGSSVSLRALMEGKGRGGEGSQGEGSQGEAARALEEDNRQLSAELAAMQAQVEEGIRLQRENVGLHEQVRSLGFYRALPGSTWFCQVVQEGQAAEW